VASKPNSAPYATESTPAPLRPVYVWLCAIAVFLSAFLLFVVEPLFAKMILPFFGGSASVWATCLVFFQSTLLVGYLYADLTTRMAPWRQVVAHLLLLICALFFLPLAVSSFGAKLGYDPVLRLLCMLAVSLGIPFLVLSATSPLIQSWLSLPETGAEPYHLFAVSNFASLLALIAYPFVIEPRAPLGMQARVWSVLFVIFAAIASSVAWSTRGAGHRKRKLMTGNSIRYGAKEMLHWIALAVISSMLLVGVTNYMTQNVTPVPLLWVMPLALYLLSFTLAFSRRRFYVRWLFIRLLAVSMGAMAYAIYDARSLGSVQVVVPLFCLGLFVCCMFCHGELSLLKPTEDYLTRFYLMVALGGALGAAFVGLIAPLVFSNYYELPAMLFLLGLLALGTLWSEGWAARALWATVSVAMLIALVVNVRAYERDSFVMIRNFYGALRVTKTTEFGDHAARMLYHGTIRHGAQYILLPWRKQPTTYYALDSGIGYSLRYCCAGTKRVGVIGLGVGTLSAYGHSGDYFHYYEINPDVIRIASSVFTYLRESPASTEVSLGDARLSLQGETSQNFDVLAVDAFSGDAIPVHLLTREAFALYLRHLKPGGILAVHTSNTYLALDPVVKELADSFGYPAISIRNSANEDECISSSDWILITKSKSFLNLPVIQNVAQEISVPAYLRLWTDEYNNLFQVLKPIRFGSSKPD
jgi:hypothetical protein